MTGFSRNITPQMRRTQPAFLIAYLQAAPRYHQDHGLTLTALIIVPLDTRVKDKEKEKTENDYDINENYYQW